MNKEILRLAIPSIISNITVPLLGLVDVAITGHMGAQYMAAIAVGSMVFNLIYWLFTFLRYATGGLTAQAYGNAPSSHDNIPASLFLPLNDGLRVAGFFALLLMLLQAPLFQLLMWIIEPEEALMPIVHTYYNICIWGAIPSLSLHVLTGWFVGMQNTKYPMYVAIAQNIINILLSLIFVYVFQMKIEGVALGTVIAQWAGGLMAWRLIPKSESESEPTPTPTPTLSLSPSFREGLGVGSGLFIRTLFLVAVNLYFVQAGAKGGADMLAVNSVLMQLFILNSYVMDGFAFAAEALCGRFYGAKDQHSFNIALKGVWHWSLLLCLVFTVCYAFGSDLFLRLLTDAESVRLAAQPYLPWAMLLPLCAVQAFVWDGVFVGITEIRGLVWGTFVGALGFFLLYLGLYPLWHNHALWLAFNAYLLLRGVTQDIIYRLAYNSKNT